MSPLRDGPRASRRPWGGPPLTALLVACAVLVAAFAAVRFLGWDWFTPVAQAIAFTPYAGVVAAVLSIVAAAVRRWRTALAAVLVTVALVGAVLPRVATVPGPSPDVGVPLRVMSANIHGRAVDSLMTLVRQEDPDLLSVQEITPAAAAALEAEGLAEMLPHSARRLGPGVTGTALYGRAPFADAATLHPGTRFDMARATLLHEGITLDVTAVHPPPPLPGLVREWRRDLARLPRPDPDDGAVSLLVGDFNATLDHAVMRDLLDEGYRNAAVAVGAGLRPTWRAGRLPPVTIDHILVEEGHHVSAVRVHDLARSDHRAVVADLVLFDR